MTTLFMIIGHGPNDLKIPLVPFLSRVDAEAFLLQFPGQHKPNGTVILEHEFSEVEGIYYCEEDDELQSALGKELYGKLFARGSYYPGCGGVYLLSIKEAEVGQPMVEWDLD